MASLWKGSLNLDFSNDPGKATPLKGLGGATWNEAEVELKDPFYQILTLIISQIHT